MSARCRLASSKAAIIMAARNKFVENTVGIGWLDRAPRDVREELARAFAIFSTCIEVDRAGGMGNRTTNIPVFLLAVFMRLDAMERAGDRRCGRGASPGRDGFLVDLLRLTCRNAALFLGDLHQKLKGRAVKDSALKVHLAACPCCTVRCNGDGDGDGEIILDPSCVNRTRDMVNNNRLLNTIMSTPGVHGAMSTRVHNRPLITGAMKLLLALDHGACASRPSSRKRARLQLGAAVASAKKGKGKGKGKGTGSSILTSIVAKVFTPSRRSMWLESCRVGCTP